MSTPCTIFVKLDSSFKGETIETANGDINIPEDAEYMGIYCHYDGDEVGEALVDGFDDYDEAFDLVCGGSAMCVTRHGAEYYDDGEVMFTTGRPSLTEEYLYIFEDDEWFVDNGRYAVPVNGDDEYDEEEDEDWEEEEEEYEE